MYIHKSHVFNTYRITYNLHKLSYNLISTFFRSPSDQCFLSIFDSTLECSFLKLFNWTNSSSLYNWVTCCDIAKCKMQGLKGLQTIFLSDFQSVIVATNCFKVSKVLMVVKEIKFKSWKYEWKRNEMIEQIFNLRKKGRRVDGKGFKEDNFRNKINDKKIRYNF